MPKRVHMYVTIFLELKERILGGGLPKGAKLPSEAELSEQYAVSRITSRRALNELVEIGLITRVKGAGSFSNGAPEVPVDPRPKKRLPVITLMMPFASQLGRSVDLFHGSREMAESRGYMVNLLVTERDFAKEREYLQSEMHSYAEGVIIYPISDVQNLDILYEIELSGFPIALVDKRVEGIRSTTILSDNLGGSQAAVRHLVELGHRRIVFVTDMPLGAASSIRDRFLGYSRAMAEAGLMDHLRIVDYSEALRLAFPTGVEAIYRPFATNEALMDFFRHILRQIRETASCPSAVCAVNDYVAIHLMRAAAAEGIAIPNELSLTGFDNIELAAELPIPLTTVEQDFFSIGYRAAEHLIDQIEGKHAPSGEIITLPTRLIPRKSARPPA